MPIWRFSTTLSAPELKVIEASRLDPDERQLEIWASPRFRLTLVEDFDFVERKKIDVGLRSRGLRWPINWHNLQPCLQFDKALEVEREGLLYVVSPYDDPGLNPDWFEDPRFVTFDHLWLRGVADLSTRTNVGLEEEKERRLEALPTMAELEPENILMELKDGVEEKYVDGGEVVVRPDGQAIKLNTRWEYVWVADQTKLVSDEDIGTFYDREPSAGRRIRHDAILNRQSRDFIGLIIEALRRYQAVAFEAELDGEFVSVDLEPQVGAAPTVASSVQMQDEEGPNSDCAPELLTHDDVKALAQKLYAVRLRHGSDAGRAQAYLHLMGDLHLNDIQARDVLEAMICYRDIDTFPAGAERKEGRRQAGKRKTRKGIPCFFCAETTS